MSIDNSNIDALAWLVLRVVYAWMFLYPAVGLIRDWKSTVQTTGLLFKWFPGGFALGSLMLMIFGSFSILLGFYGQFAAVAFIGFNLGGAILHYRLARILKQTHLSKEACAADRDALQGAIALGVVGHVTSAEKNFVLTAVALFFAMKGTGPLSLVPSSGVFSFVIL